MTLDKALFISQEITPYLPATPLATLCRDLPQFIQEKGIEVRTFMPKYGVINERRNQLHEVIRLSGLNILIDDNDHPLIIKVATLQPSRTQVYFIDNDDYFHRKSVFRDEDGQFFGDNAERAIFFARGVLETVKKLRWAPDIIHCQGWISHILPVYLKKVYKDDPIFASSKVVLSLYDDIADEGFSEDFKEKILMGGITEADLKDMEKPDGINLAKLAAGYSDGIIYGSAEISSEVREYCGKLGIPSLEYDSEAIKDGSYIENYNNFYDNLK